ncbi:MAG TPA: TrmH family RNA methyltransferase [Patescibacteria group bacterium]
MKKELYLILHDIRSAYNVGAILRSADGAGVFKIFLTGYTPRPADQSKQFKTKADKMIEKTALGAEKHVAWEYVEKLDDLLEKLKKENIFLAALEKTNDALDIQKFEPVFPMALLLGNEVDGVSGEDLQKCGAVFSIPMRGQKESLNVSVAAGIAMYELLRQ